MDTPILILTWNRPNCLQALITKISAVKPKRIFVWCDGPREGRPDDEVAIDKLRHILGSSISWECNIDSSFQERNLGCYRSVSNGISWFFSHVDQGIILEDDCLPDESFFKYCSELLERYRRDTRIWTISGYTFAEETNTDVDSYLFTKYFQSWGWATWRDRWDAFCLHEVYWNDIVRNNKWQSLFGNKEEARHWKSLYRRLYTQNKPDSWAFRWLLVCFCNNGLSILPRVNLVENIGFNTSGTHTKGYSELQRPAGKIGVLRHPMIISGCSRVDKHLFSSIYNSSMRARVARKLRVLWGSVLSNFG